MIALPDGEAHKDWTTLNAIFDALLQQGCDRKTVLFALGRLPGWIAHWREMHNDPTTKIGRPRQLYTGYTERDYVAMGDR